MTYNPDEVEKDYEEYNGGCWKCGKQLNLGDEQTNCDNCGSLIKWKCNNCNKTFEIKDKESNKKLRICKICGFFVCPHCGVCHYSCDKFKWQKEILNILKQDIPIGQFPTLIQRVDEIVEYVESIKTSIERKTCIRDVPISYSKGKIKSLAARADGFRIKNKQDMIRFKERLKDATDLEIGTEITVEKIREDGSYGQEYRDALNMLVCLGKFKIKWLKNKEDKEYCVFVREDCGGCEYFNIDNLVVKYCPKCKKVYSRDKLSCDNNCIWSKGKDKGELVKLKERLNNCDTCQMYRGNFKKNNGRN
jgi:hypothetical protein